MTGGACPAADKCQAGAVAVAADAVRRCARLSNEHVYSHEGRPWKDMVDSLAHAARRNQVEITQIVHICPIRGIGHDTMLGFGPLRRAPGGK
eukprot:6630865-Alexandrium_andersonii.AAC.1